MGPAAGECYAPAPRPVCVNVFCVKVRIHSICYIHATPYRSMLGCTSYTLTPHLDRCLVVVILVVVQQYCTEIMLIHAREYQLFDDRVAREVRFITTVTKSPAAPGSSPRQSLNHQQHPEAALENHQITSNTRKQPSKITQSPATPGSSPRKSLNHQQHPEAALENH